MTQDVQSSKWLPLMQTTTLWRNEDIFLFYAQDEFIITSCPYHDETTLRSHLGWVQIQNLEHFGYGIKGFTLSW